MKSSQWIPVFSSVFVASMLWVIVISSQARTALFPGNININYTDLDPNYALVTDVYSVKIKVLAEPQIWKNLNANSFSANINLKDKVQGIYNLNVDVKSNVEDLQIVEVMPSSVLVRVEDKVSKKIDVEIKTLGDPKEGFIIAEVESNPNKVVLTGAKSIVDQYSIATAKINIEAESVIKTVLSPIGIINNQGAQVEGLIFEPKEVKVTVSFLKSTNIKSSSIKLKTKNSIKANLKLMAISLNPSLINIAGDPGLLSKIENIETEELDLSKIENSAQFELNLSFPQGAKSENDKNTVLVDIRVEEIDITKNFIIPIEIINVPRNIKITDITASNINISIFGKMSQFDKFDENKPLKLDLANIKVGSNIYDMTSSVAGITGNSLNVTNISPKNIEVTATKLD